MDANGTRFHLLLGLDDWANRCVVASTNERLADAFTAAANQHEAAVSWSKRQELTLGERITVFPSAPANQPPKPEQRRSAAVDEQGEIFRISDDEHDIVVAKPGETPTLFWSSRPPAIPCKPKRLGGFRSIDDEPLPATLTLRGLASLPGGYLIAGAVELRGLLVFDVRIGSSPQQLLWPRDVAFEPFDLTATADGGVAILDAANARVWELDRAFAVVALWLESSDVTAPLFHSADGDAAGCSAPPVTIEHSFATVPDTIGIAALANGSLLVLASPAGADHSTLHRYRDGVELDSLSTDIAAVLIDPEQRAGFSFLAHDFAVVMRGDEQLVYVVGANGDQALVFRLTFENDVMNAEPRPELVVLRLFGGRGLAAGAGTVYYDMGDRSLPLVSQNRGRYQRSATVRVVKLDGKQTDCVWHRLFLDACIPPECDVHVATRAANDEQLLSLVPFVDEPRLMRRIGGSEMPFAAESDAGIGTWELLFQRATGRYLQIQLTLSGNGRATPRIRALRAYYGRFSYLEHYLPAVYRENGESSDFLERFLALFEGFFTTIEDRIAAAQLLIDIRSAPPDALEWLAGWLAIAFDDSWSDAKRRLFLKYAFEFFEWRGTPRGLLAALRLALDECPSESIFDFSAPLPRTGIRIQELFRGRAPVVATTTDDAALTPPAESDSAWIGHLERTYGSAAALNEKYGTSFSDLAHAGGAKLSAELRYFSSAVVPFQTNAHRFAVFLPLPPGSTDGSRRTDLATRVLTLEKPAHTTFTVDSYWTWFRLGEARLGETTIVDLGSRSPALIAPYAVGSSRIGGSYFARADASFTRTIAGRSCGRQPSPSGELR